MAKQGQSSGKKKQAQSQGRQLTITKFAKTRQGKRQAAKTHKKTDKQARENTKICCRKM